MSQYEYEERAFLTEEKFFSIRNGLEEMATSRNLDNKQSYFYVLENVNVSIAVSKNGVKAKYKGGQLGNGNGFVEREFCIDPLSKTDAILFFKDLLKTEPQTSYQFRINYKLDDDIEVALKYTQTWGFHLEAERVYDADGTGVEHEAQKSKNRLAKLSEALKISYISDQEMYVFKKECAEGKARGKYTDVEFREKYGRLFGLIA